MKGSYIPRRVEEKATLSMWIRTTIYDVIKDGEEIDKETLQISIPPTLTTRSYNLIYTFENHIRVSSVEEHLRTLDSNVVATFKHE
jgi:hypothetical protein